MKRMHLFEFEDLGWFPNWLRICLTRYINVIHKLLGSAEQIAEILAEDLAASGQRQLLDLCSGSGGPMPKVMSILKSKYGINNIRLRLSDLYPNSKMVGAINNRQDNEVRYHPSPIDVRNHGSELPGLRTMICSFHHMTPYVARTILKDALNSRQPIFVYEISDNSFPRWLWWVSFPINMIAVLLLTPMVRPMSWQQLVFTYLIPILPLCIAWDGAVSNARTYTLNDLDLLLTDLKSTDYRWKKAKVPGKGGAKLYLKGYPVP